jgi:hypothetical protein
VSIFDKNDDHPCPPSELRKGNPHKRVMHKVLPRIGSTGPQFGQKLGRKLIKRWYERSTHEKRADQTGFLFSPTPPKLVFTKVLHPSLGFSGTCAPPLLFTFFTKSSVVRIKSFQNLWADTQFQSVCNYTQIEDQTGITGSNLGPKTRWLSSLNPKP